jgi:hypothetical protein
MAVVSLAGQVACLNYNSGSSAVGMRLGLGWAKTDSARVRVLCATGPILAWIRDKGSPLAEFRHSIALFR